ncbi:HAD family hydrolase [Alkaliphilus hydrothermalis]|uniref:Phosphoglycolate phosphatase-like HAD superfamily hydrolase n=1 Tax=Alkaliphilus hydrothermalis TaxID=1482730 RepID=A0ABS2NT05_9FIRM|nr:haloacid dehalogenase-like hydrolase [Alkaliphilus hydrothermalis]MBM7615966.1 phosphoglycolate phosphatase-like HAD superfamily hydrolase [Alkaliphilus hydrothermalis]
MAALIFFDINGTIIKRDSRTDIPYQRAVDLFLDKDNAMEGVDTSARSDQDVFIEVLEKYNEEYTEEKWNEFLELYRQQLEDFKSTDVWRENADAVEFIQKLSKTDHKLSLISGELSIGAEYKLEKIGVWKHFPVGGFGEDGLRRFDIAETALKKAKAHFKDQYDELYIIGDTLLDIRTARHLGAKVISITTGSNTRKELEEENPDYIIDCFKEIEGVFL